MNIERQTHSQLEVKILQDLKEFGSNVSRVLGDRSNAHSLGSIHGHFVRNVIQILSRLESGVAIPKDAHPLPKGAPTPQGKASGADPRTG